MSTVQVHKGYLQITFFEFSLNAQLFLIFVNMAPTGEGLQHSSDSPAAQLFFFLLQVSENQHSKKIAAYGTDFYAEK